LTVKVLGTTINIGQQTYECLQKKVPARDGKEKGLHNFKGVLLVER
jgi:hypothetical protein